MRYLILIFLFLIPNVLAEKDYLSISSQEYCQAIYKAEGGTKAKKPYGILSVECNGKKECKKICLNTVRNNKRRYKEYGYKDYDNFLDFLASRYAPIGASNDPNNLNKNWIGNVKYFLDN